MRGRAGSRARYTIFDPSGDTAITLPGTMPAASAGMLMLKRATVARVGVAALRGQSDHATDATATHTATTVTIGLPSTRASRFRVAVFRATSLSPASAAENAAALPMRSAGSFSSA